MLPATWVICFMQQCCWRNPFFASSPMEIWHCQLMPICIGSTKAGEGDSIFHRTSQESISQHKAWAGCFTHNRNRSAQSLSRMLHIIEIGFSYIDIECLMGHALESMIIYISILGCNCSQLHKMHSWTSATSYQTLTAEKASAQFLLADSSHLQLRLVLKHILQMQLWAYLLILAFFALEPSFGSSCFLMKISWPTLMGATFVKPETTCPSYLKLLLSIWPSSCSESSQ